MRLLAVALLTLLPAAAGAADVKPPLFNDAPAPKGEAAKAVGMVAKCPPITPHWAVGKAEPLKPRKLTELPSGNMYAAVFHHVGMCEVPIVVKYGVGADR